MLKRQGTMQREAYWENILMPPRTACWRRRTRGGVRWGPRRKRATIWPPRAPSRRMAHATIDIEKTKWGKGVRREAIERGKEEAALEGRRGRKAREKKPGWEKTRKPWMRGWRKVEDEKVWKEDQKPNRDEAAATAREEDDLGVMTAQ